MLALSRLTAAAGAAANWIAIFTAAITAVFTLYVGIAMYRHVRCPARHRSLAAEDPLRDLP